MKKALSCFVLVCIVLFTMNACKKEGYITAGDASLSISKDTIKFDTVFTSVGSITQSLKIINNNNQKLLISKIKLMGGINSPFKININGANTPELNDIEIDSNDSIYVFVSVTINPNNNNLPFLINDSIIVQYNGNDRFIQLQAYGQNAHFLTNKIISTDTIWNSDLPYVLLGKLEINNNATLTLNEGCKLFFHANAPLLVNGTLIVNGNKNNEVIFSGDRIDEYYKDLPASWPGIYFQPSSKNNILTFSIIKNASNAIVVDSMSINALPKLTINQCVIDNALNSGILSKGSSINTSNSLISNCGKNINLQYGGSYQFINCTVASYSNFYIAHNFPVLQLSDASNTTNTMTNELNADFKNCIFWGDGGGFDDEIKIDRQGLGIFNVTFRNCILKSNIDNSNVQLYNIIRNIDPLFDSVDTYNNFYDFETNNISSQAINTGLDTSITVLPFDLNNNPRIVGSSTDIGCYEKQ